MNDPVLTLQLSRIFSSSSIIPLSMGSVISHNWKAAVSEERVTPSKICDLSFQTPVTCQEQTVMVTFYHLELVQKTSGWWEQRRCDRPAALIPRRHDQWDD